MLEAAVVQLLRDMRRVGVVPWLTCSTSAPEELVVFMNNGFKSVEDPSSSLLDFAFRCLAEMFRVDKGVECLKHMYDH